MDQELPKDKLIEGKTVLIQVQKSYLPGVDAYKAHVFHRQVIGFDQLVNLAHQRNGSLDVATLRGAFRTLKEAFYDAVQNGFDVDLEFCRSMLTPLGAFNNPLDDFDPERHSLEARLIPSPRLQQCAASCSVENTGKGQSTVDPVIAQVSLAFKAKIAAAERPFNQIPAGRPNQLSIHGKNLKLMGSHPEVGITIRCLATGESYFFPLNKRGEDQLVANSVSRLCILPRITFTPGTWEVSVATQYSRTYKPVKYLRVARRQFEVYNKP